VDCRLFRKNRLRWRGGRVALYVRVRTEHTELCLGMDNSHVRVYGSELVGRPI